jgi:rhamnosyltransferase
MRNTPRSMSARPTISVVIPVRNEAAKIAACLDGLFRQTVRPTEVLVLDSGSTDGTLEILAGYQATHPELQVIPIPPGEFNHGETRNAGVRAATGELCLLTVGDARAVDDRWIEQLLAPLDDPTVVAVCGSQVVAHAADTNPVEWFRPVDEPRPTRVQFADAAAFDALTPADKTRACGWDDVTALYRRDILLEIPFRRTSYSEDALWARDALRAGHALVYQPAARVYHYHREDADFAFRRALTTMYFRYRAFSLVYDVPPRTMPMLRALRVLLRTPGLRWHDRWAWARYNALSQRAVRRAVREFRHALARGSDALDALHERHCGRPPIPPKKDAPLAPRVSA